MKVKIIKEYTVREGRSWKPDQRVDVTNDFGRELVKSGYAHEIRTEKRTDGKGNSFEVEVEVVDKAVSIRKVKEQNEKE